MRNYFALPLARPNLFIIFTLFLLRFSDPSLAITSAKSTSDCSPVVNFDRFPISNELFSLLPQRKQNENVLFEKVGTAIPPSSGIELHSVKMEEGKALTAFLPESATVPSKSPSETAEEASSNAEANESNNPSGPTREETVNPDKSSGSEPNKIADDEKRPQNMDPDKPTKNAGDQTPVATKRPENKNPDKPAGNAMGDTSPADDASSTNLGAIIGGTIGGLAALAVVAIISIRTMRKREIHGAQDIDFAEVEGGGPSYLDEAMARRSSG